MKKIILLILLLFAIESNAQDLKPPPFTWYLGQNNTWTAAQNYNLLYADSAVINYMLINYIRADTSFSLYKNASRWMYFRSYDSSVIYRQKDISSWLMFDTLRLWTLSNLDTNNLFYKRDTTELWLKSDYAISDYMTHADSVSLSNRINLKLDSNYRTDTINIVYWHDTIDIATRTFVSYYMDSSKVIHWSDTNFIATKNDTISLSRRINTKLDSTYRTDTTSLSHRINLKLDSTLRTDTVSLSNRIDTKLTKADTSSLSNRINGKLSVTNDSINTRIGKFDSLIIGNGTAYVRINQGGIHLIDSATQWDDLVIPASLINPSGSPSPPMVDNTDGTWLFKEGEVNTTAFTFQMPHSWKQGTNISFHIHWCKATAGSGSPLWRSKYRWVNLGDTATSFTALDTLTLSSLLTDNNLAGQHLLSEDPDYTGSGKTFSSILIVYLERTGTASSDNYEASAKLLSVDVHYQVESFGSRREYAK